MGRRVKVLVSLVVWLFDRLRALVSGLLGRPSAGHCVILYYHAVPAVHRNRFGAQLDQLLRLGTPLPAGHEGEIPAGAATFAVTFDDGFVSVVENALPELRARGIPATIFMPTGCFGQPPSWVHNPEAPARRETVMDTGLLRTVAGQPGITIGSHTISHPRLTRLADDEARTELGQSKETLERELGHPVTLFAFPHGMCDERTIAIARQVGYRRVFTVEPELSWKSGDRFVTGRIQVEPDDWPLEFRLKASGAYRWVTGVHALRRGLSGR